MLKNLTGSLCWKRGRSCQVSPSAPSFVHCRHLSYIVKRSQPTAAKCSVVLGSKQKTQHGANLLTNGAITACASWVNVGLSQNKAERPSVQLLALTVFSSLPGRESLFPTEQLNAPHVGRTLPNAPPSRPVSHGSRSRVKLLANFQSGNTYFISSLR